jgi:hypothetical protein
LALEASNKAKIEARVPVAKENEKTPNIIRKMATTLSYESTAEISP